MTDFEYDRELRRFSAFLNTEPVIPILNRNLGFLWDGGGAPDSIEVNDGLRCATEGGKVVIGGAPYLIRSEYDRRHWIAAMRILLAHEIQHDLSSDRAALARLRAWFGDYLRDNTRLDYSAGCIIGQRILNSLEDGRVNNIVCQRFPGYVPMMRFTCFTRREYLGEKYGGSRELMRFIASIESYAVTGLALPGAELWGGAEPEAEFMRLLPLIDAAALCESSIECADVCRQLLTICAGYVRALCLAEGDLPAVLDALRPELEEYSYCALDRREHSGDGSDSGARAGSKSADDDGKRAENEEDDDAGGDKGDTQSSGGGDNSTRQSDANGSLTGEEAKPKCSAGGTGREDRGKSSSDGISSNHGMTGSGDGMKNSGDAASIKAAQEGPQSIREVLGTGFSRQTSPALTAEETARMLQAAAAELGRERASQNRRRVDPGSKTAFSFKDVNALGSEYPDVTFIENFITPENKSLPPEYMELAKRLHRRLDRLLKEQRVRTAGHRKGSLSQKALWKIEVGDTDIFQRKTPPAKCESAFYLLIDRSGSMGMGYGGGNSKLFCALLNAAVIEEALKGLARTKIVAFDGGYDVVEHTVVKDFSQKEIGCRCFDAMGQVSAGNGNKDGYSIRAAAADLEKRPEKRKLLVVLSDGLPSAYVRQAQAISDVRTAVQDARRKGVIVIPVIYGAPDSQESLAAYRQMYEKGIVCASAENILTEFEQLLFKLLQ